MSSQIVPLGTQFDYNAFKIISPSVTTDASGGTTQVNANSKFNTNLPLDKGMAIYEVDWFMADTTSQQVSNAPNKSSWQYIGQLTEALARTAVASSDPVDVDVLFDEMVLQTVQSSAASIGVINATRLRSFDRHFLPRPWLTVGQQLNLVVSAIPNSDNTLNGPKLSTFCKIWWSLIDLTPGLRTGLAQRIQISGQA